MIDSKVSLIFENIYDYNDCVLISKMVFNSIEKLNLPSNYFYKGMKILIKPNLVMDYNSNPGFNTDCLYTNCTVVKGILDYVIEKTNGKCSIVIGDAPMQECNFNNFKEYQNLVKEYKCKGYDIELVDFRELTTTFKNGIRNQQINNKSIGKIVNLGKDSEFYGLDTKLYKKLRITNYNPNILYEHHHDEVHEYYVSKYVLDADLIINVPKPKTHRKAGFTASLKNFVGINIRKEFLPHHIFGSVKDGGDEYLNKNIVHIIRSKLYDIKNIFLSKHMFLFAQGIRVLIKICSILLNISGNNNYIEGSWYGNNTICKTIVDLNKIVNYADKNGIMKKQKQRNVLVIADMIVSGEKEGPVMPSAKNVGLIASGTNCVCFDEVVCRLMGFDDKKIPTLSLFRKYRGIYDLCKDIYPRLVSNIDSINNINISEFPKEYVFNFEPSSGWKNHIEL